MGAHVELGATGSGAPVAIDLEELLATRLLVQGNSGSGKSHLLRRLLEQSAGLVQQVVIDPEGDYVTLAERYGHLVLDAADCEQDLPLIAARVRRHRVSVVLNLENLEADGQLRAAAVFLNGLFEAERDFWFPALVVVDEAQLFAPAAAADASDEARRLSLVAMTNLMCRGRKRGLAGVIATQRLAKLAKNVAAEASNFLMGRTFLDIDMARAADLLGMERRQAESFRDLQRGSFIGLGPAIARRPLAVRIGHVETADRGSAPRLLPLPEAAETEDLQNLIFAPSDAPVPTRPRRERREATEQVLAQIETRPAAAFVAAPPPALSDEEREAAIDEIIRGLTAHEASAFQPVAALHREFLTRCRLRRLGAGVPDLASFRERVIATRATITFPGDCNLEVWVRAVATMQRLPQDLQTVFLFVARAAVTGRPCPSDEEIAGFFGSHSPGRARRLLAQLEQLDVIVTRQGARQERIVAIPELGIETGTAQDPVTA